MGNFVFSCSRQTDLEEWTWKLNGPFIRGLTVEGNVHKLLELKKKKKNESGVFFSKSSKDGFSTVEDKKGLEVGVGESNKEEEIGNGRVHLNSQLVGPENKAIVGSSINEVNGREEEKEDIKGEEKSPTRVTWSIVFVTSEAVSYSKTGGLGDVCGSLPIAVAARGQRVMVVSPRYVNGGPLDKNCAAAIDLNCRI